jgi:hypothetical protein
MCWVITAKFVLPVICQAALEVIFWNAVAHALAKIERYFCFNTAVYI